MSVRGFDRALSAIRTIDDHEFPGAFDRRCRPARSEHTNSSHGAPLGIRLRLHNGIKRTPRIRRDLSAGWVPICRSDSWLCHPPARIGNIRPALDDKVVSADTESCRPFCTQCAMPNGDLWDIAASSLSYRRNDKRTARMQYYRQ